MFDESEYKLNEPFRIKWLLSAIQNQHQVVMLSLTDSDLRDRSIIVDISADGSSVLLEGVIDKATHRKISNGHSFSLSSSHDGVEVLVDEMSVVKSLTDNHSVLYEVPFPSEVFYRQRRETYRVSLDVQSVVPVSVNYLKSKIVSPDEMPECSLSNISADGCLLKVAGAEDEQIFETEEVLSLAFELPGAGEPVSLEGIVCHGRYIKRLSVWLIGCKFQNILPATQSSLEKQVVNLQILARQKSLLS